jgi:hypothetical protein
MGRLGITLCTAAALAVLTPAAYAAEGGGVTVTPSTPAPGADVALRVSGCSGRTGTAVSSAFVADVHLAGAGGVLAGDSRIRTSLAPGTYDVKTTCADVTVKGRITVVAGAGQQQPPPRPTAPASPVAPVRAGGGGTAHLAATATRAEGPGTAHAVTGLILAGAAAVAVLLLPGAVGSARAGRTAARRSRRTD